MWALEKPTTHKCQQSQTKAQEKPAIPSLSPGEGASQLDRNFRNLLMFKIGNYFKHSKEKFNIRPLVSFICFDIMWMHQNFTVLLSTRFLFSLYKEKGYDKTRMSRFYHCFLSLCQIVHICVYVYTYISICIYIYIK